VAGVEDFAGNLTTGGVEQLNPGIGVSGQAELTGGVVLVTGAGEALTGFVYEASHRMTITGLEILFFFHDR